MPNHVRNRDRFFGVLILLSLLAFGFSLFAHATHAAISACSVSVSPNSQNISSSGTLIFSITNNDQSNIPIEAITITAPSNNFTITSATGTYEGAVEVNSDGSAVTIRFNGWLQPGEIGDYSVDVTTGGSAMAAASFGIQASDTFDGVTYTGCSGDTGVSITSPGQAVINITNATASITATTANISWNTSVSSTGGVDYGTTNQYGSTATDSNLSTSHSVNLTGLSASTTYHYRVFSTDTGGNTAQLTDNTFTTALPGTNTVTTVTVTTTTSPTTVRAIGDTTKPSVTLTTDISKPFAVAPEISGKATDASKIVKIEYSVDGGANWLPADAANLGEKSTSFSFTPDLFEDGNYKIVARALDGAGNWGRSGVKILVIDRLPPLVGGNIWSIGPITLIPENTGVITTLAGVDNKITMSAVGGPTSINLFVGDTKYPMMKSIGSGLWSGVVNFASAGFYIIKVKSIDGAGNNTERNLNSVLVIDSGKVIDSGTGKPIVNAKVSVYQEDQQSKIWSIWDGVSFDQKNPETTTDNGTYSYFLPSGSYYLTVTVPGYKTLTSNIFELGKPTALNMVFEMKPRYKFMIGSFAIAPPDISFGTTDIIINEPRISIVEQDNSSLIGTVISDFVLPKTTGGDLSSILLRGKPQVVIFLNTWLPATSEQISQIMSLDEKYKGRVSLVVVEENLSKVFVYAKRGGYEDLTIAVDPDGTLVAPYKINVLPTSYFIDKKGVIQKVVAGTISGSDIINYIDSI